jgi:glycosyltransferase involved in cell wall biosynthesis
MIDPANPDYATTPLSPRRPRFGYRPVNPLASPHVTIVTPFHNTDEIFLETARSVLTQSLQQWEWLIVNDGSTDAVSLSILERYRNSDPRIRVIDHPVNRGLSAARNTGFRAARAPYVIQLDSDDLLEPTAMEKWIWCLESHPEFSFVKGYTVHFGAVQRLWNKGFHDGSAFLEDNVVAATSAIRTSVHSAVDGYDEANRGGLEDWDFWLRCANAGYWGGAVPEYLDWYRRRHTHGDRWENWDNARGQRAFHAQLRQRYPRLWRGGFPRVEPRDDTLLDEIVLHFPWENLLRKEKRRLVVFLGESMIDAEESAPLVAVRQALAVGWEVSIVTTHATDLSLVAAYARLTPDLFVLPHFLREHDYPRFLRYFLASRQIDVLLLAHTAVGYLLLPALRRHCPWITCVGFWGADLGAAQHERAFSLAMIGVRQCDLHIVTTPERHAWLTASGVDPAPIHAWRAERGTTRDVQGEYLFPLVEQASRGHGEHPPSLCEKEVELLSTTIAVDLAHRERRAAETVGTRDELRPRLLDPRSDSWRTLAYFALRRLIFSHYRTASERHKKWLLSMKDRLKRMLTP